MSDFLIITHVKDYPTDREQGWSNQLQGVSHDDGHWFISQKPRIWKIPVLEDLNSQMEEDDPSRGILTTSPFSSEPALQGYNHLGDLDWYAGRLYVAVEDTGENHGSLVAVFDAGNLSFLASAVLPSQGTHAPWCAINPLDGLLYSSPFDGVDRVFAYNHNLAFENGRWTLQLSLHHDLPLFKPDGRPLKLDGI